ncbi:MAG: diacylglycerol kinase [Desulfuromonadales bacterium C00003094]|jgi:diacylglycerol kinase (ATP)|nr:MAG: diacylglycerol kinase [Desulfuromonadales bacterium C00003094]OEU77572.1 MAG: diacylglycerol kinase [Desulfuromonadales bacterium C00003107]
MKPTGVWASFNCAIEGILWTARTQRHLRYHLLVALGVLVAALFFRVSSLEFILLVFGMVLVFFAELLNTAIEVVVDMVSPEYHPLARRAKDVAAGAVLMACIGAAVMGYLALSSYFFTPEVKGVPLLSQPPGDLEVVSVLVVTILVVLLKARTSQGSPLHGGMPSGHAAFAFSVATSAILSGAGQPLSLLVLAMAVMVSQSRVYLKIHTYIEVLVGALLGVTATALLYLCFG